MGSQNSELMRLVNSKDVLITALKVLTPAAAVLRVAGASSEGIVVNGGDTRKAVKPVVFEKNALKQSVTGL
jgi:hypothetical protein